MNLDRMRSINLGMSIHSAGLDWSHIDIQLQELPLDTAGDVTPELFLDTASNASPESSLPVSVPKPRPLNVADKYKIVGGVPAFVWKPFQGFSSLCRVYAISSDGTHIAIQEHWTLICVYNMQENFSFVAKWEDISYQRVVMFTFHNDKNNQLVVVFEDSTVALLHVAMNSEDSIEEPSTSEQQSGAIGIGKWFKMLINYAGMRLGFSISNKGCETWVLAEDWNFVRSITLLSIVGEEFRLLKIKSKEDIMSVFDYHSIAHNALMLVQFENNETSTLRTKTIIYNDIDFTKDVIEELPTTLENGQTFGFSECGRYFLIWTHNNVGENAIVFYGIRHLKRPGRLIARRPIGRDILIVRGHFIKRQHNAVELFGVEFENHQMVAYLVANTNQVSLMFWHPPTHTIVRKFNVTMKEVELQNPIHIEFSISSNAKWVAVGYYTQGIFGLFSIVTRSLVWSIKLNTNNRLLDVFIPLAFDGSSTKLIINACETLYVVCPPCLIEDYKLHFHQTTYDLIQDNRKQMISLQIHHQNLIPKDMLKEMLILKYGKENVFVRWLLDISCSRITPALAFLFKLNEKLLVIQEPMRTMETQIFKNDFTCASEVEDALRGLRGLVVDESLSCNPKTLQNKKFAWIFLYANEERDGDLMVVFLYQLGLLGCFINTENHMQQDRVRFSDQEPYILRQTKNGNQISCLFDFGVTVIDLKARETIHNVEYKVRQEWLSFIPSSYRKESFLDVIDDGNTIIIGWDVKKKNLLTLTSRTEEEECNNMIIKDWNIDLKQNKDNRDIVPCWMFHEESKRIAFLDFTEDYEAISFVCIYDMKNNNLKRIDRATWNPHSEKILDLMTSEHLYAYTLHLDESNGHLWIIALQNGDDTNCMICKPISPYSLGNCIPCLNIIDHSTKQIVELEELGLKFRHALSTMMFNGKTNFRLALENKNMSLMTTLVDITEKNGASSCELVLKEFGKEVFKECLDNLVEDKDEFGMMLLLNLIKNEVIPFAESASMMEHGIQKLWMKYQSLIEPRIIKNAMVRKICEIEVPVNVLIKSKNVLAMMGTHDSIPLEWEEQDGQMNGTLYWRSIHENHLRKIEQRESDASITAIVTFFAISNVCKVGLKGILRFFLMQQAPSYIFKAPLLRWVIEYKWQKIWKQHSLRSFRLHIAFVIIYSIYSIWTAFRGRDLNQDVKASVCSTILLFILISVALFLLYKEYVQMMTYIKDGMELFPNNPMWGFHKYWSSMWNIVEVVSYIMVILVIPIFHTANLVKIDIFSIFLTCIAFETILIWMKVWYFAQAFEETGAFVLMIENVIKDIASFLLLAIVILIGFSFTLFILFQYPLQTGKFEDESKDNEVRQIMEQSFGDPWKTIITLFYAMIGTFEPQIYYNTGSFSFIITIIFVLYLSTQMIVMINMLIAIMGDTFDRVKSIEEEQLLMGRARFIDACEAQLSTTNIKKIEDSIGKYLYCLVPKEGERIDEIKLWQGRVKTIEEKVSKTIKDSQREVTTQISNIKDEIKGEIKDMKKGFTEIKQVKHNVEKMKCDIDEIKQMLRNPI